MTTPCEHCGAVPIGDLCGFPMIMHAKDCPHCPKPLTGEDGKEITYIMCAFPPARFLCGWCKATWNEPREEATAHALNCPANPLTN